MNAFAHRPPALTTHPDAAYQGLAHEGYALIAPQLTASLADTSLAQLNTLRPYWDHLPLDTHLRDGGRYRQRRHGSFIQTLQPFSSLNTVPHRAHWQPTTYNALHGGIERWFEPLDLNLVQDRAWLGLLDGLGRHFARLKPTTQWFIEAHAFRIDTTDGVGRPTPEGAHRDGVDFVAVILIERLNIRGGETRVFQAQGPHGVRFTLTAPWSALLIDDATVIHESTPIQPNGPHPHRDTLVLTYRQEGFQDPTAE